MERATSSKESDAEGPTTEYRDMTLNSLISTTSMRGISRVLQQSRQFSQARSRLTSQFANAQTGLQQKAQFRKMSLPQYCPNVNQTPDPAIRNIKGQIRLDEHGDRAELSNDQGALLDGQQDARTTDIMRRRVHAGTTQAAPSPAERRRAGPDNCAKHADLAGYPTNIKPEHTGQVYALLEALREEAAQRFARDGVDVAENVLVASLQRELMCRSHLNYAYHKAPQLCQWYVQHRVDPVTNPQKLLGTPTATIGDPNDLYKTPFRAEPTVARTRMQMTQRGLKDLRFYESTQKVQGQPGTAPVTTRMIHTNSNHSYLRQGELVKAREDPITIDDVSDDADEPDETWKPDPPSKPTFMDWATQDVDRIAADASEVRILMAMNCPDFMVPPGTPVSGNIHSIVSLRCADFLRSFVYSMTVNPADLGANCDAMLDLFAGEDMVQNTDTSDKNEVIKWFMKLNLAAKCLPHHMLDSEMPTINRFKYPSRSSIRAAQGLNLKFDFPKRNDTNFMDKAKLMKERPTEFMLSVITLIHQLMACRIFRYHTAQSFLKDVLSEVLSNELDFRKRLDAKLAVAELKWLTLSGTAGVRQNLIADDSKRFTVEKDILDFCKKEQYELMQVVHHAFSAILLRLMGAYLGLDWYEWIMAELSQRTGNSDIPDETFNGGIPIISEIFLLGNRNC